METGININSNINSILEIVSTKLVTDFYIKNIGNDIYYGESFVINDQEDIERFIESIIENYKVMNFGEGYIFDSEDSFIVLTYRNSGLMKIALYSLGKRNYEEIKGKVDEIFKDYKKNINLMWYYYTDNGMSFTNIKFDKEEIPGIEFYPIRFK